MVIIGAGLAGWSVVDAIRTLDKNIPITLIASDGAHRYHKPMLSVAISQNKTPDSLIRYHAEQAAADQQIHLLAHTTVSHIDNQNKIISTHHGKTIGYDHLVLAIGATPIYPPNIEPQQAWHINNLEGFDGLQKQLNQGTPKHVAIIGAGMVGVELAEDLVKAGHTVSLINRQAPPLASLLPDIAGKRVLDALCQLGINWLGEHQIIKLKNNDNQYVITLTHHDTTHTLICDTVVVATGLAVDTQLPNSAGIIMNETGIVIDPQTLQTSVKHIYALGDCISIQNTACRYVAPHRTQAETIAHQILGLSHAGYTHKPPMIRLKNKSISVTATGVPQGKGNWQITDDSSAQLTLEMTNPKDGCIIATATLKTVNN